MTIKRTKNINRDAFRKTWRQYRLAPVAAAVGAVLMLAACDEADETVALYTTAEQCTTANPGQAGECTTAYNNAVQEAVKTAPKYATREDCVAEFGESQCTQAQVPTELANNNQTQQQEPAQASGGFWMPLMAGYMMGRMMSGGAASQPLFTSRNAASPANGKFVDAGGKNYGSATGGRSVSVPKTAMAPKPATTTTTTRGGFGDSVAKQNSMQRSSGSSSSSRSMGG